MCLLTHLINNRLVIVDGQYEPQCCASGVQIKYLSLYPSCQLSQHPQHLQLLFCNGLACAAIIRPIHVSIAVLFVQRTLTVIETAEPEFDSDRYIKRGFYFTFWFTFADKHN
jgi:hypothetical protein